MAEQAASARRGFDFTAHMRNLCDDIVARLPELRHIDLPRVAISFTQTRRAQAHGVQATLTPLRFENGAQYAVRRGRRYGMQKVVNACGGEYLYIVSFFLPRFFNHPLEDKLETVIHELWHIGAKFDGDLRRYGGRCFAHGPSKKEYDAQITALAGQWWKQNPPESLYAFLRYSCAELERHHGQIYGVTIPTPKLLPLAS